MNWRESMQMGACRGDVVGRCNPVQTAPRRALMVCFVAVGCLACAPATSAADVRHDRQHLRRSPQQQALKPSDATTLAQPQEDRVAASVLCFGTRLVGDGLDLFASVSDGVDARVDRPDKTPLGAPVVRGLPSHALFVVIRHDASSHSALIRYSTLGRNAHATTRPPQIHSHHRVHRS
jgi:hypothetical protein